MKANIQYKEQIEDIQKNVARIQKYADSEVKPVLTEVGRTISAVITLTAPESDKEYYYRKGQKLKNVHISQDVVKKKKKSRTTKSYYVTVSGGKKTWRKWHLANDGHIAENGRYVRGNYFVERAEVKSESKVNTIVDNFLRGMVDQ